MARGRLRTRALRCLVTLAVLAHLPNASGQQARSAAWPALDFQTAAAASERDHYQLLGEDEALALAASANGAQQHAFAGSEQAGISMAELLASLGAPLPRQDQQQQQQQLQALASERAQQQHASGTPGHYEFEVAPKMEPPSAPRPPFKQASTSCPGSDLFGGFSPRHTLCGDLYAGRVPLNPMGQQVNEQAYPFEVIKNKTLQFLARSLPILKGEYETIPKVARYLPAHQLLNPTSLASPLGHAHFHQLNGQLGLAGADPPPFLRQQSRRRRRKRSSEQHQASITVAELMPNATLVVSSAHSSGAGRVGHQARGTSASQPGMITREGYRPFGAVVPSSEQRRRPAAAHSAAHEHDEEVAPGPPPRRPIGESAGDSQQIGQQRERQTNSANGPTTGARHAGQPGGNNSPPEQQQDNSRQQTQVQARSAGGDHRSAAAQAATQQENAPELATGGARAQAAHSAASQPQARPTGRLQNNGPPSQLQQQAAHNLKCANVNGPLMYSVCQAASALIEGDSTPAWLQAAKQIGSLYAASASPDGYSAAAPSNPLWALWSAFSGSSSSSSPSSSASSGAQSSQAEAEQLTYKSAGQQQQQAGKASPVSSIAGVINLLNPLMSFFAPSLQRADHSGSSHSARNKTLGPAAHSTGLAGNLRTLSNLLLTGLSLAGLYDWLGAAGSSGLFSAGGGPQSASFARRKKPFEPGETFVDTPASLAALAGGAKQVAALSNGPPQANKQPPTPCPSVEEYISPTFARNYQGAWKYVVQIPHEGYFTQTIQRSSCMRQKCEFTEGVCHEAPRWVSLLVAEIYYPNAIFGRGEPPTANQQQTPSGTHQPTTNPVDVLNQRVALDQNPALLSQLMAAAPSSAHLQQVAFGNQMAPQQQQAHQPRSSAAAMGQQHPMSHHQDPLQMTDSLNNFNHNQQASSASQNLLNGAFFSAASELGLDPTNVAQMQQLANAHNYQLMQRDGLVPPPPQQQQAHQPAGSAQAESRVGLAQANQQQQQRAQAQQAQQMQMQAQQHQQDLQQPVFTSDYIKALALETIRQNPHLSIDDLIKSLQMQQARKKRDVASSSMGPQQQLQTRHPGGQQPVHQFSQKLDSAAPIAGGHHHAARRSSGPGGSSPQQQLYAAQQQQAAEQMPSINELGASAHLAQQQAYDLAGLSGQPSITPLQPTASVATNNNNNNQQQQQQQMIRSSAEQDHLFHHHQQQQQQQHQHQQQMQQQRQPTATTQKVASQSTQIMNDIATAASSNQQHVAAAAAAANNQLAAEASGQQQVSAPAPQANNAENQVECDGHDKIGCYVVRVYYDWFLVNGSCKCWKTNSQTGQSGSSSTSNSNNSGSGSSGSFIRRIFTG